MPRLPRIKAEDSIFHIMVRSIKEVPLLIDSKDKGTSKERYLKFVFMCNDKNIRKEVEGNITHGRVSKLCSVALELMNNDEKYRHIVTEFIVEFAAS